MQKFGGWLIKFGDVVLPNSFLLADGWESTPNQRVEIDAYRDANILLHRETSPNFKTKLTLNIREMNLEERRAWNNIIGLAELPQTERIREESGVPTGMMRHWSILLEFLYVRHYLQHPHIIRAGE